MIGLIKNNDCIYTWMFIDPIRGNYLRDTWILIIIHQYFVAIRTLLPFITSAYDILFFVSRISDGIYDSIIISSICSFIDLSINFLMVSIYLHTVMGPRRQVPGGAVCIGRLLSAGVWAVWYCRQTVRLSLRTDY